MKTEKTELAMITSTNEDGSFNLVRQSDEGVNLFTGRIIKDGQPISPDAEVVHLTPRPDSLYDVKTLQAGNRSGPAKVTTHAYRAGYDKIFKKDLDKTLN